MYNTPVQFAKDVLEWPHFQSIVSYSYRGGHCTQVAALVCLNRILAPSKQYNFPTCECQGDQCKMNEEIQVIYREIFDITDLTLSCGASMRQWVVLLTLGQGIFHSVEVSSELSLL